MLWTRRFHIVLCALAMTACGDDGNTDDPTGDLPSNTSTGQPVTTGDAGTDPTDATVTAAPGTSPGTTDADATTLADTTAADVTSTTLAPSTTTTGDTVADTEGDSTTAALVTASATLEPKSGSQASGTVLFTDAGDGTVDLVIELAGVTPPGTHALHIHEFPDCSAPDGESTGMHWNPQGTTLGELGTVEIADDGTGTFTKSDAWSIGTGEFNDVVGRSIIIHADPNGGTRIACGVIAKD